MTVITRFAPSPTGFLHIGGARTALFNWCYSKKMGGKFLLRIEDTDKERSTQAAIDAIFRDLKWLGIDWDGDAIYQSSRAARHAEVAQDLVKKGKAYFCYCSQEELEAMRAEAQAKGEQPRYNRMWRDRDPATAPAGVKPVIRIKAPLDGETVIDDAVQGRVTVPNSQLDDFILLRSDGSPTYMHAVVVDDADMGITHVVRGDDHLNNAFRQKVIFDAMGVPCPTFAHIPLIHGADGAKLSKRHGAQSVGEFKDMGYLPEAVCNYLLRLGWSHGDDELFTKEQAAQWFELGDINAGPSRLDMKKLDHVNTHYLRLAEDERLAAEILARHPELKIDDEHRIRLAAGMHDLKARAATLIQLAAEAKFYLVDEVAYDEKASAALHDHDAHNAMHHIYDALARLGADFKEAAIDTAVRKIAADHYEGKLAKVMMPLRASLTGSTSSPPILKAAEILGQAETMKRIKAALHWMHDHGHHHH
ncbi:MAG: glutamate--tRNA ligase [Alphaproteobacteria bacterium]|nr:glutamate--tRNA ligase [Alphaproteobacteria bacterium]